MAEYGIGKTSMLRRIRPSCMASASSVTERYLIGRQQVGPIARELVVGAKALPSLPDPPIFNLWVN